MVRRDAAPTARSVPEDRSAASRMDMSHVPTMISAAVRGFQFFTLSPYIDDSRPWGSLVIYLASGYFCSRDSAGNPVCSLADIPPPTPPPPPPTPTPTPPTPTDTPNGNGDNNGNTNNGNGNTNNNPDPSTGNGDSNTSIPNNDPYNTTPKVPTSTTSRPNPPTPVTSSSSRSSSRSSSSPASDSTGTPASNSQNNGVVAWKSPWSFVAVAPALVLIGAYLR